MVCNRSLGSTGRGDPSRIAEIIISKQRHGPIGDFKLVFRNDITKFFNYEPQPEFEPV